MRATNDFSRFVFPGNLLVVHSRQSRYRKSRCGFLYRIIGGGTAWVGERLGSRHDIGSGSESSTGPWHCGMGSFTVL